MTSQQTTLASLLQNKGISLLTPQNQGAASIFQKLKAAPTSENTPHYSKSETPSIDQQVVPSTESNESFSDVAIVTSEEKTLDIAQCVGSTVSSDVRSVIHECTHRGMKAQDRFAECIVKHGYLIKNATKEEDINSHIDFYIKRQDGHIFSVDVKAKRTLKMHEPASNLDWVYIEVKNIMGSRGWIHGDADLIAFERDDCFLVVDRKCLLEFLMSRCDLTKLAPAASEAYYIGYSRPNRSDLITLANINDVISCNCIKFEA